LYNTPTKKPLKYTSVAQATQFSVKDNNAFKIAERN